jgi:hypothetical protein
MEIVTIYLSEVLFIYIHIFLDGDSWFSTVATVIKSGAFITFFSKELICNYGALFAFNFRALCWLAFFDDGVVDRWSKFGLIFPFQTVKIFLFQTVKIFLSKLSKFSFPNCQNFPFQTIKFFVSILTNTNITFQAI